MSALARSLLALAAAALLHAASAASVVPAKTIGNCTQISDGDTSGIPDYTANFHIDQPDYIFSIPTPICGPMEFDLVGTSVMACNYFGAPPELQFLDSDYVRVSCSRTDRRSCPRGLDITIQKYCRSEHSYFK